MGSPLHFAYLGGWQESEFSMMECARPRWPKDEGMDLFYQPRKVVEMYSDTWFPERLISDKWDSSLFSILLNWGGKTQRDRKWVTFFATNIKKAFGICSVGTSVNLQEHVETTYSLDFICTDKSPKTLSQLWENNLTPSNCLHSTKGVKSIMNHASFLWEHTVLYLSPVCCCVLIATFVQSRLHKRASNMPHLCLMNTRPLNTYFVGICIAEYNIP